MLVLKGKGMEVENGGGGDRAGPEEDRKKTGGQQEQQQALFNTGTPQFNTTTHPTFRETITPSRSSNNPVHNFGYQI